MTLTSRVRILALIPVLLFGMGNACLNMIDTAEVDSVTECRGQYRGTEEGRACCAKGVEIAMNEAKDVLSNASEKAIAAAIAHAKARCQEEAVCPTENGKSACK